VGSSGASNAAVHLKQVVHGCNYEKFRCTKYGSSDTYKEKYVRSSDAFPKAVQLRTKR
jgi:hypothetical protein